MTALLPDRNGTLSNSSGNTSTLAALPPLQQSNRNDTEQEDHASHQAATARAAKSLFHIGEPEGTDESPGGADDIDEHADAGAVLDHAVDGIGDEDGGDDLVADCGDGDADLGIGVSGDFM